VHRLDVGSRARLIDADRACDAVEAIGDRAGVEAWAARFSLLADPGRLSILLAVRHAGPISVSDLAAATGMSDTAVSQALRLLRNQGWVAAGRHGRVVRYVLTDEVTSVLLGMVRPGAAATMGASFEPHHG
jgi:DNA-binding transcriptional ArsR family regulator